ncbi:hypothetical protein LX32DRAFT_106883 [Colletotrichum zoysiae]|uniref:Uncharacterized protein n=1 Tax=Colletotrichum zoysiae TaxID=1216348 RepID=A0AAD9HQB6_9PEZI|nr:hypothetical protein LX32DRAFT_106883 [Colletotrichum zoysiae]
MNAGRLASWLSRCRKRGNKNHFSDKADREARTRTRSFGFFGQKRRAGFRLFPRHQGTRTQRQATWQIQIPSVLYSRPGCSLFVTFFLFLFLPPSHLTSWCVALRCVAV